MGWARGWRTALLHPPPLQLVVPLAPVGACSTCCSSPALVSFAAPCRLTATACELLLHLSPLPRPWRPRTIRAAAPCSPRCAAAYVVLQAAAATATAAERTGQWSCCMPLGGREQRHHCLRRHAAGMRQSQPRCQQQLRRRRQRTAGEGVQRRLQRPAYRRHARHPARRRAGPSACACSLARAAYGCQLVSWARCSHRGCTRGATAATAGICVRRLLTE